jgi:uncharacterized protein (TIGR02147 family)
MPTHFSYRIYLTREFDRRCKKNASYSLRAFARDLGLPVSQLSEVIRSQSGLSEITAEKISIKLNLSRIESELFRTLVEAEHSRSQIRKTQAKERLKTIQKSQEIPWLDFEKAKIISDWYYSVILELTETEAFLPCEKWIADRLGISLNDCHSAVQRLFQFGLLKVSKGTWKQTQNQLSFRSEVPSVEFKKHHLQMLKKAESAIINQTAEVREISSLTLAISSKELPRIKTFLAQLRKDLMVETESMRHKDQVYCLALHFFPAERSTTTEFETSSRRIK